MGQVYRAWDGIQHRDVALKVLQEPAGSLDHHRFDREIRTLSLIEHENIVRLLDIGHVHAGQGKGLRFYTMELLQGIPLDAFLENPIPDRQEILWYVRVISKLLEAVEHLHRARCVHRDLNPANVMVLPSEQLLASESASTPIEILQKSHEELLADMDPMVKLMDFGLVFYSTDDKSAEKEEPGTALFMAPERANPMAPLDLRSDLYSVGVLLYQLITREFPFKSVKESFASVRKQPRLANEINPACPMELSQVICRQLSKEPHNRCRSASELQRELMEVLDLNNRVPMRIHSPSFFGRSQEIEKIQSNIKANARENRDDVCGGKYIIIGGRRGMGKSWLIHHGGLKSEAILEHGTYYFEGRYVKGGPIHMGICSILASILMELEAGRGPKVLQEVLGPWGNTLLESFQIGALCNTHFKNVLASITSPSIPPSEKIQKEQIIQTAIRIFTTRARQSPCLLILEDLQYAEELDLEILRRLLPAIKKSPITLLASYRSEARVKSPQLDLWLQEMEKLKTLDKPRANTIEVPVEFIQLEGLGDSSVENMITSMLETVAKPGRNLINELLTKTQGIPGKVDESLRDLWSQGRVEYHSRSWELTTADPIKSVSAIPADTLVVNDRQPKLANLEASHRNILAAASIMDDKIDPRTLSQLLDSRDASHPSGNISFNLQQLVEEGYLEPTQEGLRFCAPSLRKQSAVLCEESQRKRYHCRLANVLLDSHGENNENNWLLAARHFQQGGEARKAVKYYLKFARQARSRGAYHRSLDSYQQAIGLLDSPGECSPILAEQGKLYSHLGDFEAALTCLKEASKSCLDDKGMLQLLEEEAQIHYRRGELEPALELLERCMALAGEDPSLKPYLLYRLGIIHYDRGSTDKSEELYQKSLEIYRKYGDHIGMGRVLLGQGLIEKRKGELETAIQLIEEAILCQEKANKIDQSATTLHNLANIHKLRGDAIKAIECFHRVLEARETLGDRPGVAICLNNLSRAYAQRGKIDNALKAAEDSLEIFTEVGDKRGILISAGNIGSFKYFQGDLNSAAKIFQENLDIAQRISYVPAIPDALYCLGRLENARGHPEIAEKNLLEGIRNLPESKADDLRALYCAELALSRLYLKNREGASDALNDGREHAREVEDPSVLGMLYLVEAEYHLEFEDLDSSLDAAHKAVEILDKSGWKFDAALAHRLLARVYREMGPDWVDQTENYFKKAHKCFEEMNSQFELGRTFFEEAKLWQLLEEMEETERCLREALRLFEKSGAPCLVEEVERELGEMDC